MDGVGDEAEIGDLRIFEDMMEFASLFDGLEGALYPDNDEVWRRTLQEYVRFWVSGCAGFNIRRGVLGDSGLGAAERRFGVEEGVGMFCVNFLRWVQKDARFLDLESNI